MTGRERVGGAEQDAHGQVEEECAPAAARGEDFDMFGEGEIDLALETDDVPEESRHPATLRVAAARTR